MFVFFFYYSATTCIHSYFHTLPLRDALPLSMGFCLFNNVAVGALHARAVHGLNRIAVVDFDVHHGNGTQAAFWSDPDLFYASTHQSPLYPGTGSARERGVNANIVNVPLTTAAGSQQFSQALRDFVVPALPSLQPEYVFVFAGFATSGALSVGNEC